jgi:hypothetical protein
MNFCATTVDILHIADMDAQTKPAITAQNVLAYIVKQNRNKLKEGTIKMQDKTLADYIKRTFEKQENKNQQPQPEQYVVNPEDDGSDSKQNPYSQH